MILIRDENSDATDIDESKRLLAQPLSFQCQPFYIMRDISITKFYAFQELKRRLNSTLFARKVTSDTIQPPITTYLIVSVHLGKAFSGLATTQMPMAQ